MSFSLISSLATPLSQFSSVWCNRYKGEFVLKCNSVDFTFDRVARTIKQVLGYGNFQGSPARQSTGCFIAGRVGEATDILVLCIKNGRKVVADGLAELLITANRKAFEIELRL